MKKCTLMLAGLMVMGLAASSQPVQLSWVKALEFEKSFSGAGSGTIFSFVKQIDTDANDSLAFYGYFDAVKTYDWKGQNIIQTVNDSNTVKKSGTWKTAGRISFPDRHSAVNFHVTINNNEYVGVEQVDSTGMFYCAIYRLNTSTNRYMPITDIRFTGGVKGMLPLRSGKVFLWGDFYSAADKFQQQDFYGAAIWNVNTGILAKVSDCVTCGGIGSSGWDGIVGPQSVSKTDSIGIIVGGGYVKMVRPETEDIVNTNYPQVPNGGRFTVVKIIDRGHLYAAWRKDSTTWPVYLMKLTNNSWQTLARFSNPASIPTSNNNFNSIDYLGGKVYLSSNYQFINGQQHNYVVTYDEATGQFIDLATLPFDLSLMALSRVEMAKGMPYLIADYDLALEEQAVYALRDTTPPPVPIPLLIAISVPTGMQTVLQGTCDPSYFIDIYEEGITTPLASVVTDGNGNWNTAMMLSQGVHHVYAKSRDQFGNVSASSVIVTVTVTSVTSIPPTVLQPSDSVFVGQNPLSSTHILPIRGAREVTRCISMDGRSWLVARNTGSIDVDFSSCSKGIYLLELYTKKGERKVIKVILE